ncbi:hypothetical protein DAEQUDRAFT_761995 [Daedalea quercina L-15889]|uniref:Reverse transcriptase domain-containing protein n=1 Tax=Daedalea quercina L-15889 TaxID=1314783 RepID=A0A165TJI5_9APHY|nr:hypothetical protein DAEQUDRAFT_761995 [Daedalea quercina L-15889]
MPGNATLQFFVDDGGIMVAIPKGFSISPKSQIEMNVEMLQFIFHQLMNDLTRLGLGAEADKLEMMHFWKKRKPWRLDRPFGPSARVQLGGRETEVIPSSSMRYLGFWLDPKLSFKTHVKFYACKAASTRM